MQSLVIQLNNFFGLFQRPADVVEGDHQPHEQERPSSPQSQKESLGIGKRPRCDGEHDDAHDPDSGGDVDATGVPFCFILDAFSESFAIF